VVNQVERHYNGFGQLTAEYQSHAGPVTAAAAGVGYGYDLSHGARLATMTYPDGRVLSYNYAPGLDASIGRLSSLSDATGLLEGYSYLGLGTVIARARGNGVGLTYLGTAPGDAGDPYTGLDRFGRVVDHNWTDGAASRDRFTYTYDRNSNRTSKGNALNGSLSETYAYDTLNRLVDFNRADGKAQGWALDGLGNSNSVTTDGVSQTRSHNGQNQLTSVGGTSLAFDANGNTITDQNGHTLIYDAWNRLVEAKDGATTIQRYRHDALNRRVQENLHTASPTGVFFTAGWQAIEERVDGQTRVQYVMSPVYIDSFVLRDRDTSADGTLNERLYFHQDANFNVTAISDDTGEIVQRQAFLPYGSAFVYSPSWASIADAFDLLHGHQGGKRDAATGLIHFRNREYSPELMRWMQQDPVGFADGPNLFLFVQGRPLGQLDPKGLQTMSVPATVTALDDVAAIAARIQQRAGVAIARSNQAVASRGSVIARIVHAFTCILNANAAAASHRTMLDGGTARHLAEAVIAQRITEDQAVRLLQDAVRLPTSNSGIYRDKAKRREQQVEELIRAAESDTLSPGRFAGESIPARGPSRDFTADEREQINRIGARTGCHTCGTKAPGTISGDFIPDHQPPNSMQQPGQEQRLYPHCKPCSQRQGGQATAAKAKQQTAEQE
jgi:RHS repeat-associated protein